MLAFDLNGDDIHVLTNHFNLSKAKFESEISLLKVRNENSSDKLSNKHCLFWLDWLRQSSVETIIVSF